MKTGLARCLLGVGAVLLLLGSLAGVVDREVLDGRTFARHADDLRQDPDVARLLGMAITDRVLALDPDLFDVVDELNGVR